MIISRLFVDALTRRFAMRHRPGSLARGSGKLEFMPPADARGRA